MACGSQLLFLWVYIHHQERTLWAGFFSVWKYVDFGVDLSVKCPTAVVGDWKQESVASSKHTWDVQGALGVWLVLWLDTGLFISLVWMSRTLWTAPVVPDTLLGHPNHQMTQLCHQTSGTIQLSSQHLSLTEKVLLICNCSLHWLRCFRHSVSFNVTSGILNFSSSICCSKQVWVPYKFVGLSKPTWAQTQISAFDGRNPQCLGNWTASCFSLKCSCWLTSRCLYSEIWGLILQLAQRVSFWLAFSQGMLFVNLRCMVICRLVLTDLQKMT